MKILIVEDNFINRKVLQKIMSKYGECDIAINGIEACDAVKIAYAEKEPYDLLFLDIMMPKMDGQEALRNIRKLEDEQDIFGHNRTKIIMLTALDDKKNILKAFREQCEGYLTKPIRKENIIHQLKALDLLK